MVAVAVATIPLLYALGDRLGEGSRLAPSPLLGKPAPVFSLPRIDGEGTVASAPLAGRPYVVNFWASWCAPCREENGVLDDFHRRAAARGIGVVGIAYADRSSDALDFRRSLGGTWPLAADPGSRTAIDFGVFGVPETFLVDGRGRVMAKFVGALPAGALDDALARLEAGEGPLFERNDRYRRSPGE